jgi:5-methylcytosine-specific restriction enzyme subunit McrC
MSIAVSLQEWQSATSTTHTQLAGLELPRDDATQRLVQALSDSERLKVLELRRGVSLEASSYVGRIALGELQITIRPKITMLPLLHLLQYTYGLRQLDLLSSAEFDTESLTFQDLLINQLLAEVSELLLRGLHRRYVRKEEMLVSPRGRIVLQTIANQGGIVQASLPCLHHPRLEDCLINQVLLQGVSLGARLANDDWLRTHLLQVAHFHLADIAAIQLNQQTLKRLHREMDRLTTAYTPSITLIEMLLAAEGINLDESQPDVRLPGFLFDMNRFFQELLSRFLREHLQGYTVQFQFEIEDMLVYVDNPQHHQTPKPRPDYVVKQGGKVIAVLDAKYRDLWEKPLPPSMLYQLVMYALSQEHCNSATILYPTTHTEAREAKLEVRVPAYGKGFSYVVLRPVHLLELETLLMNPEKKMTVEVERERAGFARWLAFGEEK